MSNDVGWFVDMALLCVVWFPIVMMTCLYLENNRGPSNDTVGNRQQGN